MGKYQEIYWECIDNPEFFFVKAAAGTIWLRLFDKILNGSKPSIVPLVRQSQTYRLLPHRRAARGKQSGHAGGLSRPKIKPGVLSEFCSPVGSAKEHDE